jgi:hypothetical protein
MTMAMTITPTLKGNDDNSSDDNGNDDNSVMTTEMAQYQWLIVQRLSKSNSSSGVVKFQTSHLSIIVVGIQNAKADTFQLPHSGLFALFFLAAAIFTTPDMPDNDGFYHIKLAWLMRTEGLKPEFPWIPLSILNEREFYDHHFLFHVALIPFTFGDLRIGAKLAAVTFASLSFLAVWYLFYRQRVPMAWLGAFAGHFRCLFFA